MKSVEKGALVGFLGIILFCLISITSDVSSIKDMTNDIRAINDEARNTLNIMYDMQHCQLMKTTKHACL